MKSPLNLARFFGTKKVRIFSYWRVPDPEKVYPQVRDRLGKAARLAEKNGIVLVLENEHECNVGTGKELGRILRDVNSPALRGVWDPGNAVMLGETPFPDGYLAVKGCFRTCISRTRARIRRPARSYGRPWAAASSISKDSLPRCIKTNTPARCRWRRITGGPTATKSRARANRWKGY